MMRASDEEQLFRDELAERRRERDREREPARIRSARLPTPDHRLRNRARLLDLYVGADPSLVRMECPSCHGPVYAPAGSNDERVDCVTCDARLVTAQTSSGVVALLVEVPNATP